MSEGGYGPDTMKKWKIWAAFQVGLICYLELVYFGNGLEGVLGALAFSIITILFGVLLSAFVINGFLINAVFHLFFERPIVWDGIIVIVIAMLPITAAVLFFFFATVYKILTGDYGDDTAPGSAVLATAPLYCRVSYDSYKSMKQSSS